ncbi:MAG: response regulator [Desulfobacteraceae bacterium]|nr:MAG: response regulator [Desulfobacteraceae bacterium]
MKKQFTILIADRNRYVREFLRRELIGQGYQVKLAKSGREVLELVFKQEHLDLLILDLDLPDAKELSILEKVGDRIPTLPVVVHAFLSDYPDYPSIFSTTAFVEKKGTNIDHLKQVVLEVLRKSYPNQFQLDKDIARQPA